MVYDWLKMASQGLGMVSNHFCVVFGTFQIITQSGPSDPLFIADALQQMQEISKSMLACYFCKSEDPKYCFVGGIACISFLKFWSCNI